MTNWVLLAGIQRSAHKQPVNGNLSKQPRGCIHNTRTFSFKELVAYVETESQTECVEEIVSCQTQVGIAAADIQERHVQKRARHITRLNDTFCDYCRLFELETSFCLPDSLHEQKVSK